MLFMVIERFKDQDAIPVYQRVRDPGITSAPASAGTL
jgi:hypothetical protein